MALELEDLELWLAAAFRAMRRAGLQGRQLRAAQWQALEVSRGHSGSESEERDADTGVVAVSDKLGRPVRSAGHAQALLHRAGHKALARRLSREARGRNVIAHPDVTLPRDVAEALQTGVVFGTSEGESSTQDASKPEVVEVTEDEYYGVSVSERGVQTDFIKKDEPQGSMAEATRECWEIVVNLYGKLSELSEAVRLVVQLLQQQTKGQADLADVVLAVCLREGHGGREVDLAADLEIVDDCMDQVQEAPRAEVGCPKTFHLDGILSEEPKVGTSGNINVGVQGFAAGKANLGRQLAKQPRGSG